MPDLTDLLADEASRQVPTQLRPFEDLVRSRDARRRRRLAVSGVAAVALIGSAVVVLAQPGSTRPDRLVTDPTPRPYARCAPSDLRMSATWAQTQQGALIGLLTATNPTGSACELLTRPSIFPLVEGGQRAAVQSGSWSDARWGDEALLPGESASAFLHWSSWCGPKGVGQLEVGWPLGRTGAPSIVTIETTGSRQPTCTEGSPAWAGADWFEGLAASPSFGHTLSPLTVSGLLELVGGPSGLALARPGRVSLTKGDEVVIADTDESGRFTAEVTPGTWTVTATSPSYNSGEGRCFAQEPVRVAEHGVSGVRVVCPMK